MEQGRHEEKKKGPCPLDGKDMDPCNAVDVVVMRKRQRMTLEAKRMTRTVE